MKDIIVTYTVQIRATADMDPVEAIAATRTLIDDGRYGGADTTKLHRLYSEPERFYCGGVTNVEVHDMDALSMEPAVASPDDAQVATERQLIANEKAEREAKYAAEKVAKEAATSES